MRLFIAAELPAVWREELWQAGRALARMGVRGRFTPRENFHLTLAFLGEVSDPARVAVAMEQIHASPFPLKTASAGHFSRRGGSIWWVGIAPLPGLMAAQEQLSQSLRQAGFVLEKRRFSPHLTLARKVSAPAGLGPEALDSLLPPMKADICALTLMRSDLSQQGPSYTPIYRIQLGRLA